MNKTVEVPFLDLITAHQSLEEELVNVFRGALRTGRFVGGPEVEGFEKEFAAYCGTEYCIGVGSGTDALRFALIASGVAPGDTVLTVANTFIATTEAVSQAGGTPAFIDIDELTYNMDPAKLKDYLETRCELDIKTGRLVDRRSKSPVTAVIPVHIYGQIADMDIILDLAAKYNLIVVEDACQAHGARYFSIKDNCWKTAGSMGAAAAFSFYPGKNLGAFGEAGAVTTNSREIAEKVRMLRDHGQIKKYFHEIEGYNGRLDSIQAGVLRIKLKHLDSWNEKRRRNASIYNELLGKSKSLIAPHEPAWSKAVYHLYVVRVKNRDALQQHLSDNNSGTGLHYPVPLHLQKAYAGKGCREGDLPVTEKVSREIISLPMYPELGYEQQERVASLILGLLT